MPPRGAGPALKTEKFFGTPDIATTLFFMWCIFFSFTTTVETRASAENFSGGGRGPIRIEPVSTTKNKRLFEILDF